MTIYMDNSATTKLSQKALEAMISASRDCYGNPSAIHSLGQKAKTALESARKQIASSIGAHSGEIYFTSGGTEADNWAIRAAVRSAGSKGRHIIASAVEHSAVLRTLEALEADGYEVTRLIPDADGLLSQESLERAIRDDTILVSIMMANNVVGTVFDIKKLCETAHKNRVLFHTDAVQAVGHIPLNVRELGIDYLSASAHKFNGPKGAGFLFARIPRRPFPYIFGGGQEKGARSGTEDVPGIIGMAAALEENIAALEENIHYLSQLSGQVIDAVLTIPGAHLTGHREKRLPGLASFVFDGIENGAYLIEALNEMGICASSGSACSASSKESSHVLEALGIRGDNAHNALRISLSRANTRTETDRLCEVLPLLINRLRLAKKHL